jgi:hypothetical protein
MPAAQEAQYRILAGQHGFDEFKTDPVSEDNANRP